MFAKKIAILCKGFAVLQKLIFAIYKFCKDCNNLSYILQFLQICNFCKNLTLISIFANLQTSLQNLQKRRPIGAKENFCVGGNKYDNVKMGI